jgi:predicted Rdx family selenoprotein
MKPHTAMISPIHFVEAMARHWTERLANVSSEALRKVWHQLAATFGKNIYSHDNPDQARQWTVLQPPTGSGKSQGTVVYCSMLSRYPDEMHPGVLIVTRLKADADSMARQINDLSGKDVAVAYHSDSKRLIDIADLRNWPVLVITHRAYELALDYLGQDGSIQQTWPLFHSWNEEGRKLVVIDECLDIVEQSQAGLEGLRQTLAAIPQSARERFPEEVQAIQFMADLFTHMDQKANGQKFSEAIAIKERITQGKTPDLSELRRYLRDTVRFDRQIGKNDLKENERLCKYHDERLKSLHSIFRSWVYYAKIDGRHTLNTARLLIPEGVKGAVVLDATASSNVLYEVFDDAEVIASPPGSRSYRNVTLHVSDGHRVGKGFMEENTQDVCSGLVSDLNHRLAGRKVLIITHKDVEPVLASFETAFDLSTAHWGKVDGSNEWRDCEAAVIFGLPYRPDTWPANVFMACQGVRDSEWLNGTDRRFGRHRDIRRALKTGQMIVNVVQAINRARCRRVIDDQGNCPPTDVYIMLPKDHLAEEMLDGIKREMPGIVVVKDWDFIGQKKRARRSNHEQALMKYIQNMETGSQAMGTIKRILGISQATMERLTASMKDPDSELAGVMADSGVQYVLESKGKIRRGRLVKS